jgi:hypothetical protein
MIAYPLNISLSIVNVDRCNNMDFAKSITAGTPIPLGKLSWIYVKPPHL